ncbi:hypothetical protein BDA96_03G113000 [Sorghum bicolor]|uniref:Glycosyltransferase 61 catalytic domain-containing protein n=1 Tax=Sorghum bicolor TaxID=4558 RepID=A0A921RBU5_SORBI|nr:uncharacterized protein LOC8072375 [Sorghum bicolor]KAG0537032.1 hypothetical protein BDA96_03G113000 [Sorghum bicolor]|eukprot:XP_002457542.1 uncharacterized protein LOC8072375 [Sorghum bicolor]
MAASSKASSSASGLKPPAMDDAAGAAAAVSKASKGGRGAFLAHFFLVLSVVTLCAVVYAPRFFVVSGPAAPYGAAAIVAIISSAPRPSSSTSRTPSSSAAPAPPLGGPLEHGAGRGGAAAADQEHGGGALHHQQQVVLDNQVGSPCSSLPSHTICCDRSDYHSDVCFMSGDVRTDAASLSLLLFPPPQGQGASSTAVTEERIRPYTRKWDAYITKTIHEVRLRRVVRTEAEAAAGAAHRCDVRHDAPVFVVTAGGYSHNMFHVFNDGFLPLWLTAQHLRRRVVLAVLSYSPRWAGTYGEILSGLSRYRVIDLLRDTQTHCFPGAVVGTRYHDYLAVNSTRLRDNRTIVDFHDFLAGVYDDGGGGGGSSSTTEETTPAPRDRRPRLGIVSRKGRRVIENQAAVAALAASVGFDVDVMETATGVPLSAVYASVSSYDALVGVHGADLTAFLFLRPGGGGAALVQIAPLGIAMLSRNLFGVPAARMGLRYEQYDVSARESSLSRRYPAGHVVVADPARARREQGKQEWELVEHVYLRGQNVSLDLGRFRETLARIHSRLLKERQQRHVSAPDASPQI